MASATAVGVGSASKSAKGKQRIKLVARTTQSERAGIQKSKSLSTITHAAQFAMLSQAPMLCVTMPNDYTVHVACSSSLRPAVVENAAVINAIVDACQQYALQPQHFAANAEDAQPMSLALKQDHEHAPLYDHNGDDPATPYCDTVRIALQLPAGSRSRPKPAHKPDVVAEVPAKVQRLDDQEQQRMLSAAREQQQQQQHIVQPRPPLEEHQPAARKRELVDNACRTRLVCVANTQEAADYAQCRTDRLVPQCVAQLVVPDDDDPLASGSLESAWARISLEDCVF